MMSLGIDPATRTGLAVVDERLDLRWHKAITPGMSDLERLGILRQLAADYPITAVGIEVPPKWQGREHSSESVTLDAGSWRMLCSLAGLPEPALMGPSTWRAKVNMPFAGKSRETLKRMARDFCRRRWAVDLSEDEADAALIALAVQQ